MSLGMGSALIVSLVLQMNGVLAQNNSNATSTQNYTSDPFLQYQPQFARSLPVQLLITGVVLTLTTTLLIQLCFTWQYHWPLARINWTLQFTGVCTLLINIMAIMFVVLNALVAKSKEWPYMFEYVAIDVPRIGYWSIPEISAWYVMEACTSALASITHIQFLTFLYPSRLESRLVFLLLGPLALVASIMTLLPISVFSSSPQSSTNSTLNETITYRNGSGLVKDLSVQNISVPFSPNNITSDQQQLYDIIDAARNICNLTLSLLFTLSLLIWGFLVNRNSAWRTDGGTAVFGAGACFLAMVSTGLNFLNVFVSPRFGWLSPLLWAVVLWQSFLGWWWWVGSASGIAAREFDMEKRGRKERKRANRQRRKLNSNEDDSVGNAVGGTSARIDRWKSSVGVTLARRRPSGHGPVSSSQSQTSTLQADSIELTTINSITPSTSGDTHTQDNASTTPPSRLPSYSTLILSAAQRAWRSLRQAHVRAARVQAIEHQIQIQMQLENGQGLGRFPGGTGGDRQLNAMRGDDAEGASDEGSSSDMGRKLQMQRQRDDDVTPRARGTIWWGPLKRWRLRDSTTY